MIMNQNQILQLTLESWTSQSLVKLEIQLIPVTAYRLIFNWTENSATSQLCAAPTVEKNTHCIFW